VKKPAQSRLYGKIERTLARNKFRIPHNRSCVVNVFSRSIIGKALRDYTGNVDMTFCAANVICIAVTESPQRLYALSNQSVEQVFELSNRDRRTISRVVDPIK